MKLLGIRFCCVDEKAKEISAFLNEGFGLTNNIDSTAAFAGGVFANEDGNSWVEVWQSSKDMPEEIMLQLVVDDADEYATFAKSKGVETMGPMDAHGERIYYTKMPNGLNMSFQSKVDAK